MRRPLPYAFARTHQLLLEDDGHTLTLWHSDAPDLSAWSEVTRRHTVQSFEYTDKATLAKRISEAQYLNNVKEIMEKVLTRMDSDLPEVLWEKEVAKAFYGLAVESLNEKLQDPIVRKEIATATALQIDDLIKNAVLDNGKPIIDWQHKTSITGKLLIEIGDYLIDEVRDKYNILLSFKEMDEIATKCIDVAKIRYK